jgi:hypothetical protein
MHVPYEANAANLARLKDTNYPSDNHGFLNFFNRIVECADGSEKEGTGTREKVGHPLTHVVQPRLALPTHCLLFTPPRGGLRGLRGLASVTANKKS